MEHPTERLLGLYALSPTFVGARLEVEEHLSRCAECRMRLEAIKTFDATLSDPEVWLGVETQTRTTQVEELRAFTIRSAIEDAEAAALLRDFEKPEAATNFVWEDIPSKPEFQTGGVARKLCKLANGMCGRQPLYALTLAEAATAIAALLPDTSYPRKAIHELRGETFKEQANAFHHLGRFRDALTALAKAEAEYRKLPHEGIGLVAVKYVRAAVFYEQEQFEEAEALARESAAASLHLGAIDRYILALHLVGEIRFDQRQFEAAIEIFARVLTYGEERNDPNWIARTSLNLGNCHIELGNPAEASEFLSRALRLFAELEFKAEVTRTNWSIARLLFLQGHAGEAVHRLRAVIRDLTVQEMLTDAAIAAVDLAEVLNATGRLREIPKVLAGVVRTFTTAGKLTGALTALAYLKDASLTGPIEPTLFPHVRRFILRADRQADLLFLPPPESL